MTETPAPPRIVLYEPEIPQNTGAILRLCACFGAPAAVIEPCGFVLDDRRMRRAGMDYLGAVSLRRYADWPAYRADPGRGRLVLLTTKADTRLPDAGFEPGDDLLFGRESAGVPDAVQDAADLRLRIPLRAGMRSLNLAQAAAIALAEALRQTGAWPAE